MTPERLASQVKARALELGFDTVGITDLAPPPHADSLARWLEAGMDGTMAYMRRQASRRIEPATIALGTHCAVIVTKNHYQADPHPHPGTGRVAKYARGLDYHRALEPALRALADHLRALGAQIARWYVDHGPVPERELAQRAGLGWIGKNTMLIDPHRGSHLFLASVLTDLDLALDDPFEADRCGSCVRCLEACPTGAFPDARVLDSRRCISYLTIEHRGEIDPALQHLMEDWVFGCDICQDVCPWNVKFATEDRGELLENDPTMASLDLRELATISDEGFDRRYGHTALERTGAVGIRRNATIAMHNTSTEEAPWPTSRTP